MTVIASSTEVKLTFIPRKLQYSSKYANLWMIILPPQTLKNLRVVHGTLCMARVEDRRVCILIQSSVESDAEYNNLKPPKAITTEEVLMSLNVSGNTNVSVNLCPLSDVEFASSIELSYVEHMDQKEGMWKSISQNYRENNVSDSHSWLESMDASHFTNDLHPPSQWWNSLLTGEMNYVIRYSLSGSILFHENVISMNLKGILVRFRVSTIRPLHSKAVLKITSDTDVNVTLDHKFKPSDNVKSRNNHVLAGLKKQLEILKWHVIYPLIYDKYQSLGIYPPSGIILYGPPGSGKTLLAKSIEQDYKSLFGITDDLCHEICFKSIKSSDLISSIVGKTEENLNELFKECENISKTKKCICFIDEIDILCQKRETGNDTNRRVVTSFLNNMDSIKGAINYTIIGMTNDINSMDLALRRPGRFDLEIEIGVPTQDDRLEILKTLLSNINHSLTADKIHYINDFCQAFVGADIKALIANASAAHLNRIKNSIENKETSVDSMVTLDDFKEAIKITRPSALKELYIQIPNVKWEDIGGYETVKLSLKECVEYPRTYGHFYEALHIQPPRGILLYGPPGCSKTLMAKAVATESHMNFISVKGPELFSKWVGESERAIRQLFEKARTNSPCIIFFDEIDSVAINREDSESTGVGTRVLSQLLNEMDGINALKQVIVIGATNRPDMLDPALIRPGRLDRLVYVPLPDFDARVSIFKIYLGRLLSDFNVDEVSLELAEKTENYSGAEIALLCKESAMCALREHIKLIDDNTSDSFERTGIRNNAFPVSKSHLIDTLSHIKPRTKKSTIRFYEEYSMNHPF
ncbi:ATPase, AAA family domain containing protein [Theileria equi strain WA]|uniref:ATPase, AAA family domain containing protein n=1 Tax=Theileria equi strain WA TaxID=1537102 RepID=L0AUP0_THEEQ|nr:ATPase, AAA family domain containing protein [Theileria equi strain WA]AFZ78943.1 ATPase, AAA family domain containing protein [Theileria equi strain WA]|eukprot:XP_004828609.1 ATPase, AAA family domain containing protein [Theileria equi strain WA]